MLHNHIQNFCYNVPKEGRLLAIDYGKKRLGTAICDPMRIIASPFKLIVCKSIKQSLQDIIEIIQQEKIVAVSVGLPIQMDGKDSTMTQEVRNFAQKLDSMIDSHILLYDERLTSKMADQSLGQFNLSYQKKRQKNDCMASTIILREILTFF